MQQYGSYGTIIYLVALVAIFYFMIIRPQQQRQKQHQQLINNLKPEVNIITLGGILGKVVKVNDTTVVLKIAENVKIEVLKSAIAQINQEQDNK